MNMEEQIYRFSSQIGTNVKKIFALLDEKTKKIEELEEQVGKLQKLVDEQKKIIEDLNNKEFNLVFGDLKSVRSDKKKEFIKEIDELIRVVDNVSKKLISKK